LEDFKFDIDENPVLENSVCVERAEIYDEITCKHGVRREGKQADTVIIEAPTGIGRPNAESKNDETNTYYPDDYSSSDAYADRR
jgi:hypothetical protein